MSFLISLLVVLHLLCWAVALGIWVAAARTRRPNAGMAHGVAGAVVIGILLAVLVSIVGDPNHMKLGLKLVVGLVAVVLAYLAKKKGPETSSAVWFGIPASIVLNVIIAVFV